MTDVARLAVERHSRQIYAWLNGDPDWPHHRVELPVVHSAVRETWHEPSWDEGRVTAVSLDRRRYVGPAPWTHHPYVYTWFCAVEPGGNEILAEGEAWRSWASWVDLVDDATHDEETCPRCASGHGR